MNGEEDGQGSGADIFVCQVCNGSNKHPRRVVDTWINWTIA